MQPEPWQLPVPPWERKRTPTLRLETLYHTAASECVFIRLITTIRWQIEVSLITGVDTIHPK